MLDISTRHLPESVEEFAAKVGPIVGLTDGDAVREVGLAVGVTVGGTERMTVGATVGATAGATVGAIVSA